MEVMADPLSKREMDELERLIAPWITEPPTTGDVRQAILTARLIQNHIRLEAELAAIRNDVLAYKMSAEDRTRVEADLRADKERLDWIEQTCPEIEFYANVEVDFCRDPPQRDLHRPRSPPSHRLSAGGGGVTLEQDLATEVHALRAQLSAHRKAWRSMSREVLALDHRLGASDWLWRVEAIIDRHRPPKGEE